MVIDRTSNPGICYLHVGLCEINNRYFFGIVPPSDGRKKPHITLLNVSFSQQYLDAIKARLGRDWEQIIGNKIYDSYREHLRNVVLTMDSLALMGSSKEFLVVKYRPNDAQAITNFRIAVYRFLDNATGPFISSRSSTLQTATHVCKIVNGIPAYYIPLHSYGRGVMSYHMTIVKAWELINGNPRHSMARFVNSDRKSFNQSVTQLNLRDMSSRLGIRRTFSLDASNPNSFNFNNKIVKYNLRIQFV